MASYLGLIPREHSSGGKQRLGAISKQGNRFMRQLLVESVQTVNRLDEGFRKQYQARCYHKAKGVAKVAAARKLAVRLYWMLRQNVGYPEIAHIESSSRVPLAGENHAEELIGRSRIQTGPCKRRRRVRALENGETVFPLSHRPGGWVFALKNHGRRLGRIDGWWSESLPEW